MIALGGDGTILRALQLAMVHHSPVLGVNFGHLGFLADVDGDDLPSALDRIARGEAQIDERTALVRRMTLMRMALVSRGWMAGGGWRADRVADLLAQAPDRLAFFAGCSEEQAELPFNLRVLLTAPRPVLVERLRTRSANSYGRDGAELSQVLVVEDAGARRADLFERGAGAGNAATLRGSTKPRPSPASQTLSL